jgi:hypothetical protein
LVGVVAGDEIVANDMIGNNVGVKVGDSVGAVVGNRVGKLLDHWRVMLLYS